MPNESTARPWLVAQLSISLSMDYQLQKESTSRHELPGPPGVYHAIENYRHWTAADNKHLHVYVWNPSAPYPGGPMQELNEWQINVAGAESKIIETSMFMGIPKHVLVTHLHPAKPPADVMIFAENVALEEFKNILTTIKKI